MRPQPTLTLSAPEQPVAFDLVLDLPAGSLHEARRFVLSFGRHARALEPRELVEEMRDEVREMSKDYGA